MKNSTLRILLTSGLVLALFACTTSTTVSPKNVEISGNFASRTDQFSFDFLKTLHEFEKKEKNFFVSPLSLHMALGMLLNGAENDSKTEIINTLKLQDIELAEINKNYLSLIEGLPNVDPKVTNTLANSIWQSQSFQVESSFTSTLEKYFNAELFKEDFSNSATLDKINNWASDNTNEKITKILNEISADQVLFLINALYFKGDWSSQFDKDLTFKTTFNGLNTKKQIDMMQKTDTLNYADMGSFSYAELPYSTGKYSMSILLPNEENDINDLIESLDETRWKEIDNTAKVQKIELQLPKLKMEYTIKLNEVLAKMGMPSLFTSTADLSKISPPAGRLKVGFVKQDTYLDINEEGTEAAAVTTIGIEVTSLPSYPRVICNKPYLFIIREKSSNTIQFIGKVVNF